MNKKIWAGLACASLLVGLSTSGCKEETALVGDNTGYLSLALNFDPSPLKGPRADRSRADETSGESNGENTTETTPPITESDLSITLSRVDGALPPEELTVDSLMTPKEVYTGDYTIEASYGTDTDEGWDSPYYYGSQDFTVSKDNETQIELPVQLANAIINIAYTDGFVQYLDNYTVTVTSSSGTDFVWRDEWKDDGSHELYVVPGTILLTVEFTKPNGTEATIQIDPFEAEAQHRYTVTLDVDYNDETLSVTTDDTVVEKQYDIDISDANLPRLAPKPTILLSEDFTPGMEVDVVSGNKHDTPLIATIVARGGIKSAQLTFESAFLTSMNITSPVELTDDNANLKKLTELGLVTRGLTANPDIFAIVDFSQLVANIAYVDGEKNSSSFSLTVADKHDVSSDPADLFTLNVEKLNLEILDGSAINDLGHAEVIVRYNGASPDNIEIVTRNDWGRDISLDIAKREKGNRNGTYNLIIEDELITLDKPLTIRAKAPNIESAEFTLDVPPFRLMEEETNAFAKYAYATVLFTTPEAAADYKNSIKFEAASDSKHTDYKAVTSEFVSDNFADNTSHLTAVYKLTGLTPGTNYVFHATVPNVETTESAPLVTESASQLTNSNMEDWYNTEVYTNTIKYGIGTTGMTDIVRWYPNKQDSGQTVWATRNALTTGQTSGTTCYYTSFSGTIPVDGVQGKAAEISTLGYGEGTAYAHTGSGKTGAPNKKAVGMLFNGSYENETEIYGIPFSSRPSELSFQYKFAPVNNESFIAYIVVEHRENNQVTELGRGEIVSGDAQNSFTDPIIVPITYTNNQLKATHIYTVFKSSTTEDDNVTVLSVQGKKNALNGYSDSKYVGSVLTVDNIMLNY